METTGIIDTGNNLRESISGKPVVVGELSAIAPLFTYEEIHFFKSGNYANVPDSLETKIRLIPCKSVSGECLLPCVITDKMEFVLNKEKNTMDFVALALSDKKLSDGEYGLLLHSEIVG